MQPTLSQLFTTVFGRAPSIVTQAPGRIEFIGNHTDYNGGTVLGAAIDRGVTVAIAPRTDGMRQFYSAYSGKIVALPVGSLEKQAGAASWVNYPLGVLAALPAFGLSLPGGFDYLVTSDLPSGAGLSSSAALELASALAFLALDGQTVARETLVKIGRHAENHFVGVPCGILDQGVSGFGRRQHLVFIDCQGPSFATVPLPAGLHFWIFNTHTKHALVDGLYATRHRECMEAARLLGVPMLVEATPASVLAAGDRLPAPVAARARHVVEEIARVEATVTALRAGALTQVGQLLTASHRSSQHFFANSTPELDFLVDTLTATPGVLGARLTGGGFGGAVLALTSDDFSLPAAETVAAHYAQKYGTPPDILHLQSGNGASVLQGPATVY